MKGRRTFIYVSSLECKSSALQPKIDARNVSVPSLHNA